MRLTESSVQLWLNHVPELGIDVSAVSKSAQSKLPLNWPATAVPLPLQLFSNCASMKTRVQGNPLNAQQNPTGIPTDLRLHGTPETCLT